MRWHKRGEIVMNKTIKILLKGLGLVLLLIWTLFPVYWMFSLSIRSGQELSGSLGFLPSSFTMEHFQTLFEVKKFGTSVLNSMEVTLIAVVASLILGMPCAYIFSRIRFKFRGRNGAMFWILLTRVLPPIAFTIPLYTMMNRIGLLGTKIPIILAHILITLPYIIWFLISFFAGLPEEIEESAKVDGAGEWTVFLKIVLPLVAPGITAAAILSFMTSWNEYIFGVIFVQSPKNFTIPLALATLNSEQELAQWGSIAAGGIISLIPILLFVIFAQNYLISGLSSGSVKE